MHISFTRLTGLSQYNKVMFQLTFSSWASFLAPFRSSSLVTSKLFTEAAQCNAVFPNTTQINGFRDCGESLNQTTTYGNCGLHTHTPWLSALLTFTPALMRWRTRSGKSCLAARISGVVPSSILASRSVARLRSKILTTKETTPFRDGMKSVLCREQHWT